MTLTPASVAENASAGTVVGTLIAIDDDPGDSHSFALRSGSGSQDNFRFEIQGNQLVVKEDIDADFEEPYGDLKIRIRATDSASKFHDSLMVIELMDDWSEDEDQDGFSQSEEAYFSWAASAGLSGSDANPGAVAFSDGVENLLKYAFNMDGSDADFSVLVAASGISGLPLFEFDQETGTVRLEYVRRKSGGLVYEPSKSEDLAISSWLPMEGSTTVTDIDADWERVMVVESCVGSTCFYVLSVEFP